MGLTKLKENTWRLDIVTNNIEQYLGWLVEHDHSVKLGDFLNWDTVWQFSPYIRQRFYARVVSDAVLPTLPQLIKSLREESKKPISSLVGYVTATQDADYRYKKGDRWAELMRTACSSLTQKEQLRVWKMFDGDKDEGFCKKLLASVYPCKFYMLVMTETSKNEHLTEWKAIFERRMKE
jgi:hypothetical protein